MNQLKLDLLQNCFNFVKESLNKAMEAEYRAEEWKYSILFLVQAIELALKEKLKREHPILIYKNIDKPNETISLEFAMSRIQNITKISLTKSDISAINKAKQIRNQIVHYEIDMDIVVTKITFSSLLGFLDEFVSTHLKENLRNEIDEKLWKEVLNIDEYLNEISERALLRLQNENIDKNKIIECYECGYETFVMRKTEGICYVCNFKNEIVRCSKCNKEVIETFTNPFDGKLVCLHCHPFEFSLFDVDGEDVDEEDIAY